VGGWEKFQNAKKKKRKEKKKMKKKKKIKVEKGKTKINMGWHRDRKENLAMHHPSTLVHWWVLVHFGLFCLCVGN